MYKMNKIDLKTSVILSSCQNPKAKNLHSKE